MLVTSIMAKLPMDIKRNMARAHRTDDWTYEDFLKAIRNEIEILEMGKGDITKHRTPMHPPTASFMTNTDRKASQHTQSCFEGKVATPTCVFCNDPHTPTNCHTVRNPKQRLEIVRQSKLCFNCLGRHRVSQCNSKHHCPNCTRKYHTRLCSGTESTPDKQSTLGSASVHTWQYISSTTSKQFSNCHKHESQKCCN